MYPPMRYFSKHWRILRGQDNKMQGENLDRIQDQEKDINGITGNI